jgi:DNA-binding NarL/FixJ family response regulator
MPVTFTLPSGVAVTLEDEQLAVLTLVAQGWRYWQIARAACLSERTIKRRVARACERMGACTCTEAVAWLAAAGLVRSENC